ncbi:MAG: hypothetical protein ABJI33_01640 [Balneola sp.]
MNLYSSKTYSDEEGNADQVKSAMIFGSKDELLKIYDFFDKVKELISTNNLCHITCVMILRNGKKTKISI